MSKVRAKGKSKAKSSPLVIATLILASFSLSSQAGPVPDADGSQQDAPGIKARPSALSEPIIERTTEDNDGQSFVALPVLRPPDHGILERQIQVGLTNRSDIAYYAQLNIGSPPQQVYVQLDTGSFELWVNPDCTTLRPSDRTFCESTGVYNPSSSLTASRLGTNSSLLYAIGAANITYLRDDIALSIPSSSSSSSSSNRRASSSSLTQVQFGTATRTRDKSAGILGLGHGQNYTTRYPTFLDQLALQGLIRAKAFSLALGPKEPEPSPPSTIPNEDENNSNNINNNNNKNPLLILGGIDTAKFSGSLTPIPVIPGPESPDKVARYWVSLSSISLTPPSGRTRPPYPGSSIPIFLDSGATMTFLPRQLADAIASDFGSPGSTRAGFYPVDCDLASRNGTLDFNFSATMTIRVSYTEMIRRVEEPHSSSSFSSSSSSSSPSPPPSCVLGFIPSDDFVLLGDTFLRSAYVVFDLEADVIYMSQYRNCGSRITEIRDSSLIAPLVGLCPASSEDDGALSQGSPPPISANGQEGGGGRGGEESPGETSSTIPIRRLYSGWFRQPCWVLTWLAVAKLVLT